MTQPLNLDELRRRLADARGPRYWRSLEEIADTPEFRAFAEDEFPTRTPDWNDPVSRRRFLAVMGASIALAGASACTKQPPELIVPYVRQPEDFVPGKPLFYATAMITSGFATGVLAESHLGRPTKIEGNPDHPASLGATTPAMQASILTLYDPDRSQTTLHNGEISAWGTFINAMSGVRDAATKNQGAGLRILTGTVTSPTLADQMQQLVSSFPQAKWHQWEPCGRHAARAGSMAAFGKPWNTIYRFDQAQRIVSLDADFLAPPMPGSLRYTRDYTNARRSAAENGSAEGPRLYVAESTPSLAGGMAEHRFRMRAAEIEAFAAGLAQGLNLNAPDGASPNVAADAVRAIVKDLDAHRGSSMVIPGEFQSPRVHALAHAMNQALGNIGKTVIYTDPVEANPGDDVASLAELVNDIRNGAVETLLILGGNPVYDAPADHAFLDALQKVKLRAHLGLYADETAAWCHWHVPEAHYLESWNDARAFDGTVTIVQPLIEPIYSGKTAHEVLNILLDRAGRSSHDTVRDYWQRQRQPAARRPGTNSQPSTNTQSNAGGTQNNAGGQNNANAEFEAFWQTSLNNGVVEGTAFPGKTPPTANIPAPQAARRQALEIVFRPDPEIGDGRLSNNAWLQETPKPQNTMTWDNAVWLSPKTAQRLGIATGDVVEMALGGRKVQGAAWIQPGQADDSAAIHFGYGRTRAGRVADNIGFNAYALRNSNALWHTDGLDLKRISRGYAFATRQMTQTMEERDPFRVATLTEYAKRPEFARPEEKRVPPDLTLFPMWPYPEHKWGMSIDLTACTGCTACMAACQAENNIPVVGKEEVIKSRHMNWIRVDRYFAGPLDDPAMYFQPVPCMHCETAPCELVCPVAATVHSGDGLNQMIYNRCVGTRYCSNNCPYKVRRFNFFLYSDWDTRSLYGARNPDVTVRSRGVMEKCTYCIQRINAAKIEAEKQNRPIRDGEIVTACAQACPGDAIVFGDLNDPNSKISRRKRQPRDYLLLEELNTRPRTTYLARLGNPNPEFEKT